MESAGAVWQINKPAVGSERHSSGDLYDPVNFGWLSVRYRRLIINLPGKFDDLPGKGKPLRLDDNSMVGPEWRLTSTYKKRRYPAGIGMRQEIEAMNSQGCSGSSLGWQSAIRETQFVPSQESGAVTKSRLNGSAPWPNLRLRSKH
jgi:hypothetical protein